MFTGARMVGTVTVDDYRRIFLEACGNPYGELDALETLLGYSVHRERIGALEAAARTLACPYKAHAPNWQHGRLVYAAARARLSTYTGGSALLVDIGTAKGFSALCLAWALVDSGQAFGRAVT